MDDEQNGPALGERFAAALAEVRDGAAERPRLAELAAAADPEVFEHAVALTGSADRAERELGLLVLHDLGPADGTGRRPFGEPTATHLQGRLRVERDPWLLGQVVDGLGAHGGGEALADVTGLADHADDGVRYRVAAVLPLLLARSGPDAPGRVDALDALHSLCKDDDPDVRYYALTGLLDARLALTRDDIGATVTAMLSDDDELIRTLARDHAVRLAAG